MICSNCEYYIGSEEIDNKVGCNEPNGAGGFFEEDGEMVCYGYSPKNEHEKTLVSLAMIGEKFNKENR